MDRIIVAYLEGTATEKETRLLLDWIRKSEENKKYFFDRRTIWLVSESKRTVPVETAAAFRRFKEKIYTYEKQRSRKTLSLKIARIAASVAWICLFSWAAYWAGTYRGQQEEWRSGVERSVRPTDIHQTVVRDAKTALLLPDSSVVWLNEGSRLTYPSFFPDDERVVRLEGEGYFEVTSDTRRPFYVETERLTVKVLGTRFDVRSHPDENATEAVLLSGKVEVRFDDDRQPVVLAPSQKLTLHKETDTYRIDSVDAEEYTLWKNEKLVMEDEELAIIFRKMERWYGIRIVCKGNLPLHTRYSLTITDEPKEEIFRLLSLTTPIRYKITNKQVVVTAKSSL